MSESPSLDFTPRQSIGKSTDPQFAEFSGEAKMRLTVEAIRLRQLPSNTVEELENVCRKLGSSDPDVKEALFVLPQLSELLIACGPQICGILSNNTSLTKFLPNLTALLKSHSLQNKSISPWNSKSSVTLPFNEKKDLKHHYKDNQELFVNQNKVIDEFNKLLKRYHDQSLTTTISYHQPLNRNGMGDIKSGFQYCFFELLRVDNIAWFSRFFVDHLLLRTINGGAEEKPAPLPNSIHSGQHQDKIMKLNQRMERPPSNNGTGLGGSSTTTHSITPLPLPTAPEQFFIDFIETCDNHSLCTHVQGLIIAKLNKYSFASIPNKTLSIRHRVACCNTLSKFLGYLTHYPKFNTSSIAYRNRNHSQAFDAIHSESVEEANLTGFVGMDCSLFLYQACQHGCLTLVVPYVILFLKSGPMKDYAVRESEHMKETLIFLALIRKSALVDSAIRDSSLAPQLGFAFLRVISDVDMFLKENALQSFDSLLLEQQVIYDKYSNLPMFINRKSAVNANVIDGTPNAFDECLLNRLDTTCWGLDRLRITIEKSSQVKLIVTRKQPLVTVPVGVVGNDSKVLNHAMSPDDTVRAYNRSLLVESFLHHQADEVARIVEFGVFSVVANMNGIVKGLGNVRELVNKEEEQESVLHSFMCRAHYVVQALIQKLVKLSCSNTNEQYQKVLVEVTLQKAEAEVEKYLRRKLTEIKIR